MENIMSANATVFRKASEMTACRTAFRSGAGGSLSVQELDGLANWIDGLRADFGLPPKEGELSSNLVLRTK